MKQLTCEMCGSTELVKQEGFFVCQTCGTKYSVEEAKKMMVEVAGTVKIDNSSAIANYLSMAKNAFDADNNTETENYCNKVIEMDPQNYEAWFMKGQAVGWESTLGKIRIPETVNAFSYAIEYCPEESKEKLAKKCEDALLRLHHALLSLRLDHFKERPTENHLNDIKNDVNLVLSNSIKFLNKTGIYSKNMAINIGTLLNSELCDAWEKALDKYTDDNDGHPSDRAFKNFLDEGDNIIEAYKVALAIFGEDASSLSSLKSLINKMEGKDTYTDPKANALMITIYNNMVTCQEKLITCCSYDYKYVGGGRKIYSKSLELNEQAVSARNYFISIYKGNASTITKMNEVLKKNAREKYWQEHPEEKAELDAKITAIDAKIKDAEQRIIAIEGENCANINNLQAEKNQNVPSENDKQQCEKRINDMNAEYKNLGFFKGKEKKALMEKINAEKTRWSEISIRIQKEKQELIARVDAQIAEIQNQTQPIRDEIADLNKEKEELQAELDKDR